MWKLLLESQNVQIEEQILSIMSLVPTDSMQQRQEPEGHEEGGELQEAGQLLGSLPGHHPHQRRVQEAAPRTPL